jgi:primosomal protein N' (replication factor Y)
VALIHSRLSDGERYDTWRRIRSGQASVVVGARSALFVPLANLGLIVIDECHDPSYHQDDLDPNYHTVAAAIEYAQKTNAVFIMGSATPAVEQLYQFRQNHWALCQLPNRVLAHQNVHALSTDGTQAVFELPGIQVVDMRAELVAGNRSPLSRELQSSLDEVLRNKHQAILFLNRRGSASYVFCRDCGYVLKCSRCNSSLTFHENDSQLVCHRCNSRHVLPKKCPQCGSTRIKQFGLGTESLEKIVAEQFPQARLLRWDADTARKKGAHDLILDHFTHGRADILIGTQMIAKGLDLPEVTLVGMILADVSLNLPDFRAAERTYQLITQVAGRAGRSALGGKVILQTFNPDHYANPQAAAYDYEGFEKTELQYRSETSYPPFSRLVSLEFRHFNPVLLEGAVRQVADLLQDWISLTESQELSLIGPAPCFYARSAGQYRWQIILRGSDPLVFLREHPPQTWQPAGVVLKIRVDPPNLL